MRAIIFGATGMVGQGVLRECLRDDSVTLVLTVGRTSTGVTDPKLQEIVHSDLWNYEPIAARLAGFDACFFCLGTPSAGKSETDYRHITYDLTLAAAKLLSALNPKMTFIYVSGDGADSSEKSKVMWARVRGQTENAILALPFKAAYIFRPGVIQPLHGIKSKTAAYRIFYSLAKPILPMLRTLFPSAVSTTEQIGKAMLSVAKHGTDKKVLKSRDFEAIVKKIAPVI